MDRIMDDSDFALFGESLSQKSFRGYKTCQFVAIPGKYGNYPSGYILPKNSSIGPIFRYYMKKLIESGSVDQIRHGYEKLYEEQSCPNFWQTDDTRLQKIPKKKDPFQFKYHLSEKSKNEQIVLFLVNEDRKNE